MGEQEVIESDKDLAVSFANVVAEELPGAVSQVTARFEFPIRDGGHCLEYEVARGGERLNVAVFLGDPQSNIVPYGGKCWLIVMHSRWFPSSRSDQLFDELCAALLRRGGTYPQPRNQPVIKQP